MDLVVLVDGSGSVEWEPGGFTAEKHFTKHLFDLLQFGEESAKAGVILFSWEAELIPDVSKERTLAFLITDGNPNDMMATNAAAETFKERGRLVVVPVGGYIDYDSVMGWASYPAEENVMA